ncbi:hypothetical protein [Tuwongella immobilis]|uniref:Uncharacterized protein n=1 Tax=Tuwongella immobilis TaxID=692036 RepID=A0A6C2YWH3_9BACT|nr:hypothetical protein [Tuwongella immobilis]VIP05212.1 unnamed protein product [Tuwongella immobilis]VTS07780.1 unnamed protein product [Tuwongella immobilis]
MSDHSSHLESSLYIIDYLTMRGGFPLLFTGLLRDSSSQDPCIVSARLIQGSELVLTHTLCEQQHQLDRLLGFLQQRGVYWESMDNLWRWAVAHHWPHSGDLLPENLASQTINASALSPVSPIDDEESLRSIVTQNGRYEYDCCFSLDQLVVAWDDNCCQFKFPEIYDFEMLQSCIKMLENQSAAFRLRGFWVRATPSLPLHSFADLRRLGEVRRWPEMNGFLRQTALWEEIRKNHSGGQNRG